MEIVKQNEFDYRNAKEILKETAPDTLNEIYSILNDKSFKLNLKLEGKGRDLSKQVQKEFIKKSGWKQEVPSPTVSNLRYDLMKDKIPIEVEIGHERLVYADFFKFLSDYAKEKIPCGVMVVTNNPIEFGHKWHNSIVSTKKKLEAISEYYLVPILIIPVKP